MPKIADLILKGASGTEYGFEVYPLDTKFKAIGAVYAITRRFQNAQGGFNHDVIYIGQTGDLSERFDQHHQADCFGRHKANCACIHADDSERSRLRKEADLIEAENPPCND